MTSFDRKADPAQYQWLESPLLTTWLRAASRDPTAFAIPAESTDIIRTAAEDSASHNSSSSEILDVFSHISWTLTQHIFVDSLLSSASTEMFNRFSTFFQHCLLDTRLPSPSLPDNRSLVGPYDDIHGATLIFRSHLPPVPSWRSRLSFDLFVTASDHLVPASLRSIQAIAVSLDPDYEPTPFIVSTDAHTNAGSIVDESNLAPTDPSSPSRASDAPSVDIWNSFRDTTDAFTPVKASVSPMPSLTGGVKRGLFTSPGSSSLQPPPKVAKTMFDPVKSLKGSVQAQALKKWFTPAERPGAAPFPANITLPDISIAVIQHYCLMTPASSTFASTSLRFHRQLLEDSSVPTANIVRQFAFLGSSLLPDNGTFIHATSGHHFGPEHTLLPGSLGLEFIQILSPTLKQNLTSNPVRDFTR